VEPQINCPTGGASINVSSGLGSGSGGTICVSGSVSGEIPLDNDPNYIVAVAVFACNQGSGSSGCPSAPSSPPSGVTFATINGTTWCATGVPVPSSSTTGDLMIVYAWVMLTTNSGIIVASAPVGQEFYACQGNSNATDCCSSLPCSGGSGSIIVKIIEELRNKPPLLVTVPEGPHRGHHSAVPIAYLKWRFHVGRHEYFLELHPKNGLKIHGDSKSVTAESIDINPFAALFPGKIFGSTGDVVVTIA
jgi:hypothetical protein